MTITNPVTYKQVTLPTDVPLRNVVIVAHRTRAAYLSMKISKRHRFQMRVYLYYYTHLNACAVSNLRLPYWIGSLAHWIWRVAYDEVPGWNLSISPWSSIFWYPAIVIQLILSNKTSFQEVKTAMKARAKSAATSIEIPGGKLINSVNTSINSCTQTVLSFISWWILCCIHSYTQITQEASWKCINGLMEGIGGN